MNYQSVVKKWGTSLGIRIHKSVAEKVNIGEDTVVNVSVKDNTLILTPIAQKENLGNLLSKITPENIHDETYFGDRAGKEIW